MKILNIIPYFGSEYGGPFINAINISRHLRRDGHLVDIASTFKKPALHKRAEEIIGYKDYNPYIYNYARMENFLCFSPGFAKGFKNIVKNYDVIFIHGFWRFPTSFAAHYCRKHKIPYFLFTHGQLSKWSLSQRRIMKLIYFHLFSNKDFNLANAIFFMRQDEKAFLEKIKANVVIFKNAIDSRDILSFQDINYRDTKDALQKTGKLLYLARIHPKKGLLLLVQALNEVIKCFPDIILTVAGPIEDKSYFKKINEFIKNNKLEKYIVFKGIVFGEEKKDVLSNNNIMILPTLDDCAPLSIIEGLAAGLAVITTKEADISEIDNVMGFVVERNVTAIKEAIVKLINNPALLIKMKNAGKDYILRNFNWDIRSKELIATIQANIK